MLHALEYYNAIKLGISISINEIPVHLYEIIKLIESESNTKMEKEMKRK